jgi:hypothetical protein
MTESLKKWDAPRVTSLALMRRIESPLIESPLSVYTTQLPSVLDLTLQQ